MPDTEPKMCPPPRLRPCRPRRAHRLHVDTERAELHRRAPSSTRTMTSGRNAMVALDTQPHLGVRGPRLPPRVILLASMTRDETPSLSALLSALFAPDELRRFLCLLDPALGLALPE